MSVQTPLSARRSLVTWIDVLGFGAMLKAGDYDRAYNATLNMRLMDANPNDYEPYRHTHALSDSIIRVVDADPATSSGAIFYELSDLSHGQLNCVYNGTIVSGAMVIGDVCLGPIDKPANPMGLAVGEAYELDAGSWEPVIILNDEVVSSSLLDDTLRNHSARAEANYIFPMVAIYGNEQFFLNYMLTATADEDELVPFLKRHKVFIESNLSNANLPNKVHKKYRFLADYHNAFIHAMLSQYYVEELSRGCLYNQNNAREDVVSQLIHKRGSRHKIYIWNGENHGWSAHDRNGNSTVVHSIT